MSRHFFSYLRSKFSRAAQSAAVGARATPQLATLGFLAIPSKEHADISQSQVKEVSASNYPANRTIEDRFATKAFDDNFIVAVMDGHGGWQASEFARNHLCDNVVNELMYRSAETEEVSIAKSLTRAFERTDREFLDAIRGAFNAGFGETAHVGACAVVALVTPSHLFVANAGDCRAVLGTSDGDKFEAKALSRDHNAKHPEEKQKLKEEHPGEVDYVICKSPESCYVKGRLQPSRSLGDAYLKYAEFNGKQGDRRYGRFIPSPYTPPYITATPEVQSHKLQRGNDKFLIMGSDGVWDVLSNDAAVQFVAKDSGDRATVAARLTEHILRLEAAHCGMTFEGLLALPPGPARRGRHDDITVMVVYLDGDSSKPAVTSQATSQSWFSKLWPFGGSVEKPAQTE